MSFETICGLLNKLTPEEIEMLIEKLTLTKPNHTCKYQIDSDWKGLTCKCGNKISPLGDGVKIIRVNDLLTIDGFRCTYDTIETRSEIEEISKVYVEFCLPDKYSYVHVNGHSGYVSKIIKII